VSDPPPPPQVSPDGKFYWDGQRWVPMQLPTRPPISPHSAQVQAFPQSAPTSHAPPRKGHALRNVSLGCLGLIAVVIALGVIGSQGSKNQPALKWTVDGRAIRASQVGGSDAVQMTVTNNGPDAAHFIIYLNAKDDWFKHHVITDPDGCTIINSLERLDCGPLDAGETKTINIGGSPKDAGNFDFEADAAAEEGGALLYPDLGAITWSEAITL